MKSSQVASEGSGQSRVSTSFSVPVQPARMARRLRVEFPGAICYLMNQGDRREDIFRDDQDRQRFLETLGEASAKTNWHMHAYCLMRNHFHLVVETPQPNLVAGMKWFLGTYSSRFNRLPVRGARRQDGTSCPATCSAGATSRCWSAEQAGICARSAITCT